MNYVKMWEHVDRLHEEIEELEHKLSDLQGRYDSMNSERRVYIALWEKVPVEIRMQIQQQERKLPKRESSDDRGGA